MTTLVLLLLEAVSWLLYRLGVRRAIAAGRLLGVFAFHCVPIRRRLVLENLRRAFPDKSEAERRAIARGCYRQLGRIVAEAFILGRMKPHEITKLVRWRGQEKLEAAVAQGTGLVACMGHMGNWELMGFAGHARGYPIYAITKALKGSLNKRLHETRKKAFIELPPSGSFEQGLEALKKSGMLALIVDQHRGGDKAVVVDFFGRPASTSPSPALFALRSGAPVFTVLMTLAEDDVYEIVIEGPFPVPPAATLQEQLFLHTQLVAKELERTIREHPAEWFWVHRRWKLADATPLGPGHKAEARAA